MPNDISDSDVTSATCATAYGPAYYAAHCGPIPYERSDHWLSFFGIVADRLVGAFAPRRVFDAGCALGMLVEALWDRGVQAYGRDISNWAIDQVRPDVRPCCGVGSIADPIDGDYDLLTCIEVLEHMSEAEALQAIRMMARVAPRILFSSSPIDFDEPTHCNVRPPIYWLSHWADAGFAPSTMHDAGYLAPHAFVLERCEEGRSPRELASFADRIRHRVAMSQLGNRLHELNLNLARAETEAAKVVEGRTRLQAELVEERTRLQAELLVANMHINAANQEVQRVRDESELRAAAATENLRSELERQDITASAKAARRATEDKQIRAAAAQRAAEARVEAAQACAEAADARAEVAEMRTTIAVQQRQIAAAQDELATRTCEHAQALAAERAGVDAARHEAAQMRDAITDAWREVRTVSATRDRLLSSTVWRASWPVRFMGERLLPSLVRSAIRKSLSAVWWTATGKLGHRLGRRRMVVRQVHAVSRSPLFDDVWYARHNPDVEASGLAPALHYVTIGGPEGRDPGPQFSAARYVKQQSDIDVTRTPALVHFLQHGMDQSELLRPEPLAVPPGETSRVLANSTPDLPFVTQEQLGDADCNPSTHVATAEPHMTKLESSFFDPTPLAQHLRPEPDDVAPVQTTIASEILLPVSETASALDALCNVSEPEFPLLKTLLAERFLALEPLRTFAAPHDRARVTLVTDSINAGSLYGGVGTALILGVLLASRLGAGVRLVTRTEAPDEPGRIASVLAANGVAWDGNIELLHAPPGQGGRDIPVGPADIFLTTSWWSTWATRRAVNPKRIAYLLQEDERGFYPLGDDYLRCTETLSDPALLYVVNCRLLMTHFETEGLAPDGVTFEPACPASAYHVDRQDEWDERRNFFFYARPHNPRNLYWRGLEAIGAAIEEGVLDPRRWAFHFVGKGAHEVILPGGVRPQVIHELAWADYAGLIRQMDLGLSLMSTPHPSYPPLDLASSGAVVVTNRYANKTSLHGYSPNILCAEPSVGGLIEGLRQATALVSDRAVRTANLERSGMERDWSTALASVLDVLVARFGH